MFRHRKGTKCFERGREEFGARPEILRVALAADRGNDVRHGSGGRGIRTGSTVGRKWKSGAYKGYAVDSLDDSRNVSRALGYRSKGVQSRPVEGTVWGSKKRRT